MVKIRLARIGGKGNIFYRIVATDESKKRSGGELDIIGYWHPIKSTVTIDKEKLKAWVGKGAKVTKAVEKLL